MNVISQKFSKIEVMTCQGTADPLFLFNEYTLISEDVKEDLFNYCWDKGYIAHIEFDDETLQWVFHSLSHGPRKLIWKKPIAEKFEQLDKLKKQERGIVFSEQDLELYMTRLLNQKGVHFETQVACEVGIADIVTSDTIYELKERLTRSAFFKAIGQLFCYRQRINPTAKLAIVCSYSDIRNLHQVAEELGIEVIEWYTQLQQSYLEKM